MQTATVLVIYPLSRQRVLDDMGLNIHIGYVAQKISSNERITTCERQGLWSYTPWRTNECQTVSTSVSTKDKLVRKIILREAHNMQKEQLQHYPLVAPTSD